MMKFLVVFAILAVGTQAKTLQLVNGRSSGIQVNVGNDLVSLVANGGTVLELEDNWSGTITAVPENAEDTTGPKTKLQLSLGASDSYSISLEDGFNVGLKIIPVGSTNCLASVCVASSILRVCPLLGQVTNSNGTVVGCQSSPLLMAKICPLAVVDAITALINVRTCTDATGYLVIIS
ncbi:unnamed protein product [Ceutorhynchus assimilis]|uniref:Thaumatin-like protein n=1 Tax=Ceutorhynchus assimilis TaxID=467358 RepID=A0A9N9QSR9_9CUCU|nr:unnamed protein product [Ceutorhynchus assimilis]